MDRPNLFLDPDDDLEVFRDAITDNAFKDTLLLANGQESFIGYSVRLEGVSHTLEDVGKVRSTFLLYSQADENPQGKVEILWELSSPNEEPTEENCEVYSEFYFEGASDPQVYDPRETDHWEEILEELQS